MRHVKEKAQVLIEALPYIRKYHGKVIVVKYGGNAMIDSKLQNSVMEDIVLMKHVGMRPIIVHGGGPQVSKAMEKAKVKPKFVHGLRVTDKATLGVVEKIFGKINNDTAKLIKNHGGKAISLSGKYYRTLKVKQLQKKLGYVGKIIKVDPSVIKTLLKDDLIPIVSPIGVDSKGQEYNINADTVAMELAIALKAEKLSILTNVDGVMAHGHLISHLSVQKANSLTKKGIINKGMIPKVQACIKALKHGIGKAHLINGMTPHSLLLEFFTDKGIGTEIVKTNGAEQ